MKIRRHKIFVFLCLTLVTFSVSAAPVFYSWGGEKIIKVMDFPNTAVFQRPDGRYVDAGYRFKQVSIFFIPIWNYDEQWCGYIGSDKEYVDAEKNDLSSAANEAGLSLPDSPSLPLWDFAGGKLLIILLIAGYVTVSRRENKKVNQSSQAINTN